MTAVAPEAPVPTDEAPFGLKPDGTPRKRPAPTWMRDPAKVAAAAAKRSGTRRKREPAPAITNGQAIEMLTRITAELDEKLLEAERRLDEAERGVVERAREVARLRDARNGVAAANA